MAKLLNQYSGMPHMGRAAAGWTKQITLIRRTEKVVDGLVQYQDFPFTFKGTLQPLSPRDLMLKPEGQRAWAWVQLHIFSDKRDLNDGDQVLYNCKSFKVMGTKDYTLNGYTEYHLVEEYKK